MALRRRSDETREAHWGGPRTALLALVGVAAAVRFVGIGYGLPLPLLNPDERSIVPRAWAIVHGSGADPHWFDYPHLLLYLLAPFQYFADAPSYLAGRIVVALLGVAAVAAAWWLGERAYGPVAGAVAGAATAVETTHVTYSHAAVTDVPLTLGVAVSLALLVSGRIEWAGLAAGLAASVKYPGAFLLVPLVIAGWRRWGRLAVALALAVAAFAATSPFVIVHAGEAAGDIARVQRLARAGWLGFEHDHWAGIAFVDRLWEGLGPALLIALAGLAVALAQRRPADVVLASFVLVYFVDLLTIRAHFDRYVLPLVPALGALAGRLKALAPVTLVLLVVPLVWSIRDDRELTRTDTREVARGWIEHHVPAGSTVATDPSAPLLSGFRMVALDLPGPGRPYDPRRDLGRLRADGVDYVVVTGAVTDRVLAASDRYPRESRFYDELERETTRVYRLEPGGDLSGPWVAVYHLRA